MRRNGASNDTEIKFHLIKIITNLKLEYGVENVVPKFARDAETRVEILVVVCKVVLLHFGEVRWKLRVVQRIVHAIIQPVDTGDANPAR